MTRKTEKYHQLADCSCNMIRRSARKITQIYERNLRQAGIKPTQFTILAALANSGPVQLTQLAEQLVLERTGLTRNLNVLERNGWVQIDTGMNDSRQRMVSLSKMGYAQLDQAIPYWQQAQATIADLLGRGQMIDLRATLDQITEGATE